MKKLLLLLLLTPIFANAQVVNTILRKNTATKVISSYSSGSAGTDTLANVYKLTTFEEGQVPAWDATNKHFKASTVALSGISTFVFSRDASDISGYEQAVALNSYVEGLRDTATITATTSGVLMQEFATNAGFPNITVIQPGEFKVHYDVKKASGSNNFWTYAVILKRTDLGVETALDTTDISTVTDINTLQQVDVSSIISDNIILNASDRLVVKVYAKMQTGTASISLYYDDATYSRLTIPSGSVDASNFVPYVGATKDLDMGVFDVTADSLNGNGLGITDVVHLTGTQTIVGAKTFTSAIKTSSSSVDQLFLSASTGENGLKNLVSGSNLYLSATNGKVTIEPNEGTVSSYTTFNNIGNVGIGVAPQSAWLSTRRVLEVYNGGGFAGSVDGLLELWGNSYVDGSGNVKYLNTGEVGLYQVGRGTSGVSHLWHVAASGTAGATASTSIAMKLFSNGNFTLGNTSDGGFKLDVSGTSRITGALTLGSTISNGTYTYTLPSSTGTLALTSALSNYVDLTTNQSIAGVKTFNSEIAIKNGSNISTLYGQSANPSNSYELPSSAGFLTTTTSEISSGIAKFAGGNQLQAAIAGTDYLTPSGASALYLPLAGGTLTGALSGTSAAFSSGVSLAGDLNFTAASRSIVFNSTNTLLWESSAGALSMRTGGVDRLTIASTGAATFSGQITSTRGNVGATVLGASSATTGSQKIDLINTSGRIMMGIENSAGGSEVNGAPAYSAYLSSVNAQPLVFATSNTVRLTIAPTGAATFSGDISAANLTSGTYTPTLTNGANVASSTAYNAQYIRVGNVVTVWGTMNIDAISDTTPTVIGISVPIASNFANITDLNGYCNPSLANGADNARAQVYANTSSDYAEFSFTSPSASDFKYSFSFTYEIL